MNSSILGKLHKDKMTILRYEEVKVNGITKYQEVEKYIDAPCRLSKEKLSGIGNENAPVLTIAHKVFTGPNVDVLEGDKLIITQKCGRTYTFKAGETFPYSSHIEIDVQKEETA
ncbi:TPA: hypothetical protein JRS25_003687 [Escherichia coli]|nr:hypothetical protein [Escherichia coli]HAY3976965.1 hypothetical protein [Escherichia coli]HBB9210936.1 hypothetical protein [Escherichia coli]